ncbi:MAG: efflux RND transporter periplasmic adaptor subunit [Opitutaceae bacterium]|jgi:RND family efflux transporter MFP subunit
MTHSSENTPQDLPKFSTRTVATVAGALVLAMIALFFLGFWPRHERIKERESMAQAVRDRPLIVQTVRPELTTRPIELVLPADIHAYASTALYARTNGYLASWTVDINDRVKKGDLMAVLSAPDTDAQLKEAEANLNQQEVNYQLAAATDGRYRGLIPTQGVTQQQLDQFHSAAEQAKANVVSSSAIVDRLKTLVSFERITAPFDGVVTARNYDTGALISASSTGPGQELYDLAEDDRLRVYSSVPQDYAPLVRYGQPVELLLEQNYPGHRFQGLVARSAGTLDPVTRTLRTELDFRNGDPARRIFPGMYGKAVFRFGRDRPALTVPTSALLFQSSEKRVAVVGEDGKVHMRSIVLGNDFGTKIEVLSGLRGDEWIVENPDEQLAEGVSVEAVHDGAEGPQPGASPEAAAPRPAQP